MPDMLTSLLDLPDSAPIMRELEDRGIRIFRPLAPDKHRVVDWVRTHIYAAAAAECDVCFSRTPVSCFVALAGTEIVGFACYDAIAPDFFGPTEVLDSHRGLGLGKALLLRCLEALREEGYAYAVIGGVGPEAFYERCVGAFTIPGSQPGIYRDFIGAMKREEPGK